MSLKQAHIKITDEDWEGSIKLNNESSIGNIASSCPTAVALNRTTGMKFSVGLSTCTLRRSSWPIALPWDVQKLILLVSNYWFNGHLAEVSRTYPEFEITYDDKLEGR